MYRYRVVSRLAEAEKACELSALGEVEMRVFGINNIYLLVVLLDKKRTLENTIFFWQLIIPIG